MKTVTRFSLVFLLFLVASCVPIVQKNSEGAVDTSKQTNDAPVNPTSSTIEETAMPTADSGLTLEKLKNMEYITPSLEQPVKLIDGVFNEGDTTVSLLPETAIGDLNGDQVDDAVVLLAVNSGGTGNFVSLSVVASLDGQFHQVGSVLIDDRPLIKSLTILDNEVVLEATIHGLSDPMVSPSLEVRQTYKLLENNLVVMSQSSTIQGGMERSITIDAPLNGSEISGTVQLTGSMPVAPFENSLRFRVVDLAGKEIFSDGFMVSSTDVGGPATFNQTITLPPLPSEAWVKLELAELSMADGSLVDMNAVLVKIQ